MNELPKFYSAEEIAASFGLNVATVYNWTKQKDKPLKCRKVGKRLIRFSYDDVMAFLAA